MSRVFAVCTVMAIVVLTGCHKTEDTLQSLAKDIDTYREIPTEQGKIAIEKKFIVLAEEINNAEKSGKSDLAASLRVRTRDLKTDFDAAKFAHGVQDLGKMLQGGVEALKDAGRTIGDALNGLSKDLPATDETENAKDE